MPELDGVVADYDTASESLPTVPPHVGDGALIAGSGAPRAVGYYSFDVSELPADAVIRSATMRLYTVDTEGDPQGMMVLVRIDHVNYGSVFPQTALGATGLDFNFATISDIGTIGAHEIDVTEQLQADIDAGRQTSQYRLRGAIPTDSDAVTDLAELSDAEDTANSGLLPVLVIEIE